MVHYIRFLKAPRLTQSSVVVDDFMIRTLITITTDLGDAFYPGNVDVHVGVANRKPGLIFLGTASWRSGMRSLQIEVKVRSVELAFSAQLLLTCNASLEADLLHWGEIPDIVGAWSDRFEGHIEGPDPKVIIRKLRLPNNRRLDLYEECGESIAHHIWDAGIGLLSWLIDSLEVLQQPPKKQLSILELGTGCGIVGIGCANLSPDCRILLTDLDDHALKSADINVQRCLEDVKERLELRPLDWKNPHKFRLDGRLDLIIASDCTYNSDSAPGLVHTILHLVQKSSEKAGKCLSDTKIMVSTKERHSSEAIFFELMREAGFVQTEHARVPLEDRYRESIGQKLEVVDIHVFEKDEHAQGKALKLQ